MFTIVLTVSLFVHGYNSLYGFAAVVGIVLIAAFAAIVFLLLRGKQRAVNIVRRLAGRAPFVDPDRAAAAMQRIADRLRSLIEDRTLLRHAVSWAAANWLLDAASLWVFIFAFGKLVPPVELLVAYCLANILAVIPITPGGLGVVEGVLGGTLIGFGVSKPVVTLGVLSYRFVNFVLPIPVGGGCYLSLRVSARRDRRRRRRTGGAGRPDGASLATGGAGAG